VFTLTGFADEVAFDLGEQIALLTKLGIRHVEFRSAWRTKVLDLSDQQLGEAKRMLDEAGITVSSVGSDIGKIQITDPFDDHLQRAGRAVEVAKLFGAPYIRTFSFFIPEGDDPDRNRDEVMRRTRAFVDLAEAGGVTILHENEKDIFGDIPRRVVDLVSTMGSPAYRAIFDPANYVQCGVKPFDEALPQVRPHTAYVHIKDALAADHSVVPAGEGDGQVREVLRSLNSDGYSGFLSIEPHLGEFDAFGGLCGPDLWTTAYDALTGILRSEGIEWA
jgi:sugar phosphate isomerase/epimerase